MPAQPDTLKASPDGRVRAGVPEPSSADVTTTLFSVVQGSAVSVASPEANKFDGKYEITFTGRTSGTVRRAQLYWTGAGTDYAWRFFAEREEIWDWEIVADGATGNIETTTSAPELDGLTGSIEVTEDATAYGLIKASGNRWARQKGDPDTLEEWTPFWRTFFDYITLASWDTASLSSEITNHNTNEGFTDFWLAPLAGRWADLANCVTGGDWTNATNTDPDPTTFERIEHMLTEIGAIDGTLHFWLFGDQGGTRNMDAVSAFGAGWDNSAGWHRLARYIAARLGAYPNWAAGFGFDIWEDHTEAEINNAFAYLQARMPWGHLLGARDQNDSTVYSRTGVTNRTYDSHGKDAGWALYSYATFKAFVDGKSLPQADMDRWDDSRLSEAEQRQAFHRTHIAGGLAAILQATKAVEAGGGDYTNQVYFATANAAWTPGRFSGFVDADSLISGTGAVGGLRKSDSTVFVFYVEGSGSDQTLDLSGAPSGPLSVKRINLTTAYSENTAHGDVSNASGQVVSLPSSSDWLIVVGE